MVSKESLHPNPRCKNVLNLVGIPVEFPYKPYGSQLSYMSRVISTLDRAQRDGHCHALLESPTGTGKSLSLLCSALAWQNHCQSKLDASISTPASADPIGHGGGFIPHIDLLGNSDATPKKAPKIFYASRTHSQITQVIREYRKTTYRVPMAVLASRKNYCTNQQFCGRDNIDEQCKLLLKNRKVGCPEFKNVQRVKGHPSLRKGGCNEVHDVEDLLKVGLAVKGCSYFAARSMAQDAQIVFCPYNYVINPVIRRAMEVDIREAIVILDEAHNIEDITRDAGSFEAEEDALLQLQNELGQLSLNNEMTYQPLYETIENIISWICRRKKFLAKQGFQHYCTSWTGEEALRELQEASISQQSFPILKNCVDGAIQDASDAEEGVPHLSGMSTTVLEGLFTTLGYFYSEDGLHIHDYQLVVQNIVKKDSGNSSGDWTCSFGLWCLNPAVVFKEIADLSMSVILTSGTLSPMSSFSSELGVQFGTCLEAPHVIDVESQLWAAVISSGPGNYPLNASYKTADSYAFQDKLGSSLEEICKIVPAGCLVFFPSYKLMDKLSSRWQETGQWSKLNAQKSLFVEPRGGNQDNFDDTLKGYYNSIHQGGRRDVGRKRKGKNLGTKNLKVKDSTEKYNKGAAFLAVCRGKVSEGIDFSDDNARVVVIVGIPFPNVFDIQVAQKKKFNDTYRSSKNLLTGNEWYCQQAFRALNQAAGRCIRHRFDYGAIIFMDERFCEKRNTAYISKWLRKSIRQYDDFDHSMEGLQSFFKDIKERVDKNADALHCTDVKMNNVGLMGTHKVSTEHIKKLNKTNCCMEEVPCSNKLQTVKSGPVRPGEVIDLECDTENGRCLQSPHVAQSPDDLDVCIVKETPGVYGSDIFASPKVLFKDGFNSSTVPQHSADLPEHLNLPNTGKSLLVTPERIVSTIANSVMPETESAMTASINSHIQKRRKSMGCSSLYGHHQSDTPEPRTPVGHSFIESTTTAAYENCRIDCYYETNCPGSRYGRSVVDQAPTLENCSSSSASSDHITHMRLQIFCSLCKKPLGLPENKFYIMCSITPLSKIHLASLWKKMLQPPAINGSPGFPILICDVSSIDQQLFNATVEGAPEQEVWCKEDGCVFKTICCPFCSHPNSCLGVQVMATDASNIRLLNKILFCLDRLEMKNLEDSHVKDFSPASGRKIQFQDLSPSSGPKIQFQDLSPSSGPKIDRSAVLASIDKFSYSPQMKNSEGWRTTRSKVNI
ncbi:hypothetical protein AgCh_038285 [Apium graveolens]